MYLKQRRHFMLIVGTVLCLHLGLQHAAHAATVPDGAGNEWRQLTDTIGLSWEQVATVCPTDGVTECAGSVGGVDLTYWVWARADQVLDFMAVSEPALLDPDVDRVDGAAYIWTALGFFSGNGFATTFDFASNYSFSNGIRGTTSSLTPEGNPISGWAGWGCHLCSGSIGVGPRPGDITTGTTTEGIWLWRVIGPDRTPPVVNPHIAGTLGSNGWYTSDVTLSWIITDEESSTTVVSGCETEVLTEDTAGTEFSCVVSSDGGTTSNTVNVKRDATPPIVTCDLPIPQFEPSTTIETITGTVSDALSRPLSEVVSSRVGVRFEGSFTSRVSGFDNAGNLNAPLVQCPYVVAAIPEPEPEPEPVPTSCDGHTPTIIGTSDSEVIYGTRGDDVIVAMGGDDTIHADRGDDIICAGDGNDTVYGDRGEDKIFGEAGNDHLHGGRHADDLDGGPGNDSIRGDGGRDVCTSGEVRMSSCYEY